MAKLIAVCSKSAKDKPYKFVERQVPLEVEDDLKMVMQLPIIEKVQCNHNSDDVQDKQFHTDVDLFAKKMELLSRDELAAALLIPSKEVFSAMIDENIACVGCRRSIDQMFKRLKEQGLVNALDPLVITTRSELSLNPSFLYSPWNMHSLFNIQGSKVTGILDALSRVKKGRKRCAIHKLDSHKSKPNGNWIEVWEALEAPCREEVTIISSTGLQVTMDAYLRKHRFCTECKSKVTRAFNILIGEIEPSKEKGYCAQLYDGLRSCPRQKHIHLLSETNFIHKLIMRAEPEISGARERHAKTIDVAQEEVLTCLGLHLYDRLYRISQKLRAEEQTCHLLFYLGVERLRKAFEVAVESKRGMSMLEQVCEEINEADKLKQQKKELKKLRRKAKKKVGKGGNATDSLSPEDVSLADACDCGLEMAEKDGDHNGDHARDLCKCQEENDVNDNEVQCGDCGHGAGGTCRNDVQYGACDYGAQSTTYRDEIQCGACGHDAGGKCRDKGECGACGHGVGGTCRDEVQCGACDHGVGGTCRNEGQCGACGYGAGGTCRNDCGYCTSSSPENSDVACTEGMCNHDNENAECLEDCDACKHDNDCADEILTDYEINQEETECCQRCSKESTCEKEEESESTAFQQNVFQNVPFTCVLQNMLEEEDKKDSGDFIAEEDIVNFQRKHKGLPQKIKKHRAKLWRNFEEKFPCGKGDGCRHRCRRYQLPPE